MRKRMTIVAAAALAALTAFAAVPAVAQEDGPAPDAERIRRVREWPPAWIDTPIDELKADVAARAAVRVERIEDSERLNDDEKVDLVEAIDSLLVAVEAVDANAEVAGLVISRGQLERKELRANRRGETVDYESHIAADLERAASRFTRLTKVTGWADAAGEDVAAILGHLGEAETHLDVASGDGSVIERHDSVHIALAWMTEAAAALDEL
jgi:Spy/CpxP family protein refolding chaperone